MKNERPDPAELARSLPDGEAGSVAIWRVPVVMDITGHKSRKTLWAKARNPDDDFPAPIDLGGGKIGWFAAEIIDYLRTRPRVLYAHKRAGEGA